MAIVQILIASLLPLRFHHLRQVLRRRLAPLIRRRRLATSSGIAPARTTPPHGQMSLLKQITRTIAVVGQISMLPLRSMQVAQLVHQVLFLLPQTSPGLQALQAARLHIRMFGEEMYLARANLNLNRIRPQVPIVGKLR